MKQRAIIITIFSIVMIVILSTTIAFAASTRIVPTSGSPGQLIMIIDAPQGRLIDGSLAVFMDSSGGETDVVLDTHKPYQTAQGRLSASMAPGDYDVFFKQPSGAKVAIGSFSVKLEVGQKEEVTLEDTIWILQSYGESGNLGNVLPDTEITAEFVSSQGEVHGSGGCNAYLGNYEAGDDQLSISGFVSTQMYCPEPEGVFEQEQQYFDTLKAAESYKIENGMLEITDGTQLLIFVQQ